MVAGRAEIDRLIADAGDGSMGIVAGYPSDFGQPGHVFNVRNVAAALSMKTPNADGFRLTSIQSGRRSS